MAWGGRSQRNPSTSLPNPLSLDTGELRLTGTGGAVDCVQSTTTTTLCANSGAYGLGILGGTQNNRIDPAEALKLTLTAGGYTAKLLSFDIDGFNGTELGQYSINGDAQVGFLPSGVNTTTVALATSTAFTTVAWTVPSGDFQLGRGNPRCYPCTGACDRWLGWIGAGESGMRHRKKTSPRRDQRKFSGIRRSTITTSFHIPSSCPCFS